MVEKTFSDYYDGIESSHGCINILIKWRYKENKLKRNDKWTWPFAYWPDKNSRNFKIKPLQFIKSNRSPINLGKGCYLKDSKQPDTWNWLK